MENAENLSQKKIREFLDCSRGMGFTGEGRGEIYAWVERVPTDAADPELLGQWEGGGKALPSPQIPRPLHGGGHWAAGRRG